MDCETSARGVDGFCDENGPNPFEGTEKTMEVEFIPTTDGPSADGDNGLRGISREDWQDIVSCCQATILSELSDTHVDSYLLSESSLFVYRHKIVVKTCGTTTLLACVPLLFTLAEGVGLKPDWIGYTRKNLLFPNLQVYTHQSFQQECDYLKQVCDLDGDAYILGPLSGEHLNMYVWDKYDETHSTNESTDRTLSLMMYGLDRDVAKLFLGRGSPAPLSSSKNDSISNANVGAKQAKPDERSKDMKVASNFFRTHLLPGAELDEHYFEPCGYSMNGVKDGFYETIHITPEAGYSYASFETNFQMKSYNQLVRMIVSFFKPERFMMVLCSDGGGLSEITEDATKECRLLPTETISRSETNHSWVRRTKSVQIFARDYQCICSSYVRVEKGSTTP